MSSSNRHRRRVRTTQERLEEIGFTFSQGTHDHLWYYTIPQQEGHTGGFKTCTAAVDHARARASQNGFSIIINLM